MTQAINISDQSFKNLDAVEIKTTVAKAQKQQIRQLFSSDLAPQKLWIYFFDTIDLTLFETHQVILRARKKDNKGDDSTVKLRKVEPDWTFSHWKNPQRDFKIEGDWVGENIIRSASFSAKQEEGEIDSVAVGEDTIDKLFSKDQEEFLEEIIHDKLDFGTLKVLGPIEVYRWKYQPQDFNEEITLEYWQLANPKDILQEKKEILELSVKVNRECAQETWERFNQFLTQHDIDLDGKQEPKTRTALEFFVNLL